jgi:hypothetical protein
LGKDGLQAGVCFNMVDALWRPLLSALSAMLSRARATQEALVLTLLRAYQSFTYAAGMG